MAFFNTHIYNFETVLRKYFEFRNETKSPEPLAEVFESLKYEPIDDVLAYLRGHQEICQNFGYYIFHLFHKRPFNLSLTEADILSENAFVPEFKKRVLNTLLPQIEDENSVWYLIDYVSVRPQKDLAFLQSLPEEKVEELFRLLGIAEFIRQPAVRREMLFSVSILAWRVIGNAMDVEVLRMVPEYKNFDNPFIAFQNELEVMVNDFKNNPEKELDARDENYKQLKVYLDQCRVFVDTAFKNSSKYGISGKINQSLLKIRQQLQRIAEILDLMVFSSEEDYLKNSKTLFFNILRYKSHKNNLKELVSDSTVLMSHLITNHTAETGTHYITSTIRDYIRMFWKASFGGVIVGALCVLKMLYSYILGSDFSHAVMYSFNYAMGFIMIYLMGFTLATKQPAMTAATMAKVLAEEGNKKKTYEDFAHLVSKLFRTQFIAFVGNVLWSFPVSLAIIYALDVLLGQNMAAEKADHLLHDLDPIHSKAILHACIAGFFLFISGIIAGNVGNNSIFYHIPKRIAKNTFLNRIFGERVAQRLSLFYEKNWPGMLSNFWFGVLLGATAPLGKFIGLDLDIRHITFSAGNFALGLYGSGFSIATGTFWMCLCTVFLIGFFNFVVSFGLSMVLAFRSRKVNLGQVRDIYTEIFRYFFRNPIGFFLPLRSRLDSTAREMMERTVATKSGDH